MKLLLTLLPFYIALFLFIQLIPVRINLFFVRENKDDFMAIRVNTLFSLLRFNVEVPLIRQETPLDVTLEAELKAGQDELVREKKKRFSLLDIDWEKVKAYAAWLRKHRKMLWYISRFYTRAITIDKLVIRIKAGVPDAALSGLLGGLCWSVAGTLTAVVGQWFRLRTCPLITVQPEFVHQHLLVGRLDTAISYRIGHFTIGGLLFLSMKFRGGKK